VEKSQVIAELDSFIDFKEQEKQKQKLGAEWGTIIKIEIEGEYSLSSHLIWRTDHQTMNCAFIDL
jgi:hypothetical protein